jgi:hypothetical protein
METTMYELTQYRLARSDECLRDGDSREISQALRLRCYFDAGYFQVLAAIERADPAAIINKEGWDFEGVLQSAGKHLALNQEDVLTGIKLSEAAHLMLSEEPSDLELTAARAWAVRVRGCVLAWMEKLPTGALGDSYGTCTEQACKH